MKREGHSILVFKIQFNILKKIFKNSKKKNFKFFFSALLIKFNTI